MSLTDVDWSALPAPENDGAADHLVGASVPDVALKSTHGSAVKLNALTGTTVIYAYPMTGRPDRDLPAGWDTIPGARGCTPQSCAFRDHFTELQTAGADHVFGLSTQDTHYQSEAATRLHLPFALLSDHAQLLQKALDLPTMVVEGQTLLKRLTMILRDQKIEQVHYPVFPPDRDTAWVLERLKAG